MKFEYEGAFRGKIVESTLGFTKVNRYPQAVIRFESAERYIESQADLDHYKMPEPGWVQWAPSTITGYFCLFKSADVFDAETALPNYEQLKIATGWDGSEFDSLTNGALAGKPVLFRVAMGKPYTAPDGSQKGGDQLQVVWIDAVDAEPTRALKPLDAAQVKDLNSKLKMGKPAPKPVAAAKPASAPTATATTVSAPAAVSSKPPKTTKPPKAEEVPNWEAARDAQWDALQAVKGNADDTSLGNHWVLGCRDVAKGRKEEQFTAADWVAVKDHVVAALGLK